MNLLCTLSTHAAAPDALANQGFLFSRCRRCHRDLIRSASSNSEDWQAVPSGFRIAWRDADLSVFAYTSWTRRSAAAARGAATSARHAGVLLLALGLWRIADARHRAETGICEAWRGGRGRLRRLHVAPRARARSAAPCIVVVNFTLGRDLRLSDIGPLLDEVKPRFTA